MSPRIVVVGAGIIGVAIADALAQRGAAVTVLEKQSAGCGASRASAGILAPYVEADERSPLLALGTRSLALFDEFVAGAAARSGRRIEYARSGTLQVALDAERLEHLRSSLAWLEGRGVNARWLDPAELRAYEPAVAPALGALLIPEHGLVGVGSLVAALIQSARLAGAIFESPAEAAGVTITATGAIVRVGDRRLDADAVVVASGSWTSRVRIAGIPAVPIRPVRGQLLHLRWPSGAPPSRVVWGPDCYAVPWTDRSLLVGATMEEVGFDEATTVAGMSSLSAAVTDLLPEAASATLVDARAGLRPAAPDGLPIIGTFPSTPAVCYATGHFRNGILLAPLTAEIVVQLLLDGRADEAMTTLGPARFAVDGPT